MKKLCTLIILITITSCSKPVEDGAFVGEWYIVGMEEEMAHWLIKENNDVVMRNRFGEITGKYKLKDSFLDRYFGDGPYYYLVSSDKKDTIGTTWVEVQDPDEYKIPEDTIRFYHYFAMVRSKKLPVSNFSKAETINFLNNSYWEYTREDSTKVEIFLTDSLLENQNKRAYLNMTGCIEYASDKQEWFLDTLTNNIVLQYSIGYHFELFFIKEIDEDKMIVDRDDVYWFNKNLLMNKTQKWSDEKLKFVRSFNKDYKSPPCSW